MNHNTGNYIQYWHGVRALLRPVVCEGERHNVSGLTTLPSEAIIFARLFETDHGNDNLLFGTLSHDDGDGNESSFWNSFAIIPIWKILAICQELNYYE